MRRLPLALTVSVTMFAICIWSTTVGSLDPDRGAAFWRRSGGAFGAIDHHAG